MHNLSKSFVLGYHGCDRETGERVLRNEPFQPSENTYDWLGSGIYFWEANPDRALEWAKERADRILENEGRDVEPFVVGAVIDSGFCLDLINPSLPSAVSILDSLTDLLRKEHDSSSNLRGAYRTVSTCAARD